MNSSSPSTLIIKSTGSWPLVVSITRATKGEFGYTNFEITSHWKVNPNGLKPNDAAVETEFVITVPFLGYYSAVLEVPLAFSPSSCWHGLPALQQYLVGSYREDTCAGWELLETW